MLLCGLGQATKLPDAWSTHWYNADKSYIYSSRLTLPVTDLAWNPSIATS